MFINSIQPQTNSLPVTPTVSNSTIEKKDLSINFSDSFYNLLLKYNIIDEKDARMKPDSITLPPVEKNNIEDLMAMLIQSRGFPIGNYRVNISLLDFFLFLRTKLKARSVAFVGGVASTLLKGYLPKILELFGIHNANVRTTPIKSLNFCIYFSPEMVFVPLSNESEEDNLIAISQCIKDFLIKKILEQNPLEGKEVVEREVNKAKIFISVNQEAFNLYLFDEEKKLPIQLTFVIGQQNLFPFLKDDLQLNLNPLLTGDLKQIGKKLWLQTQYKNQVQPIVDEQMEILRQANIEAFPAFCWILLFYEIILGKCCFQGDFEDSLWKLMLKVAKENNYTEQEAAEYWLKEIIQIMHLQNDHEAIVALCASIYAFRSNKTLAAQVWKNIQSLFVKEPTDPLIQCIDQLVQKDQVDEAFALLQVISFLNLCAFSKSFIRKNYFTKDCEPVIRFELNKGFYFILPLDASSFIKKLSSLEDSLDSFNLFPERYPKGPENFPKGHVIPEINWKSICAQAQILLEQNNPFLKRIAVELILAWGITTQNNQAFNMLVDVIPLILENNLQHQLADLPLNENQVKKLIEYTQNQSTILEQLCKRYLTNEPDRALSVFLNFRSDVSLKERKTLLDKIYKKIKKKDAPFFRANLRKLARAYTNLLEEDKDFIEDKELQNILKELFFGLLRVAEWQEAISLIPYGLNTPAFIQNWFKPFVREPYGGFIAIDWMRENHPKLYEKIVEKASNENQFYYLIELCCRYKKFDLAVKLFQRIDSKITLPALNSLFEQEDLKNLDEENTRGCLLSICGKLKDKEQEESFLKILYENPNALPTQCWEILVNILSVRLGERTLNIIEKNKNDWNISLENQTHCWKSCLQGLAGAKKIASYISDLDGYLNKFPTAFREEAACLIFRLVIEQKKPESFSQLRKILEKLREGNEEQQKLAQILDFELIRGGIVFDETELINESMEKMKSFIKYKTKDVQEKHLSLLDELIEKNISNLSVLHQLTRPLLENAAWHSGLLSLMNYFGKKYPPEFAWEVCQYLKKLIEQPSSSFIEQRTKTELMHFLNRFIKSSHPLENNFLELLFSCIKHPNFTSQFDKKMKTDLFHSLFQKKKRSLGINVTAISEYTQFFSDQLPALFSTWTLKEGRKELDELFDRVSSIKDGRGLVLIKILHLIGLWELSHLLDSFEFCRNLPPSTDSSLIFDKPLDSLLNVRILNKHQSAWKNTQTIVNNAKIKFLDRLISNFQNSKEKNQFLMEIYQHLLHLIPLKNYDDSLLLNLLQRFVFFPFTKEEGLTQQEHRKRAKNIIKEASHLSSIILQACDFYTTEDPIALKKLPVDTCKTLLNYIAATQPDNEIALKLLEKLSAVIPNQKNLKKQLHDLSWKIFEEVPLLSKVQYFEPILKCLIVAYDSLENKSIYFERVKKLLEICSYEPKLVLSFCKTIFCLFEEKKINHPLPVKIRKRGKSHSSSSQAKQPLKEILSPEEIRVKNQAWLNWLQLLMKDNSPEAFLYAINMIATQRNSNRVMSSEELNHEEELLANGWKAIPATRFQKAFEDANSTQNALETLCENLDKPQNKSPNLPFVFDCILPILTNGQNLDLRMIEIRDLFFKTLIKKPFQKHDVQILNRSVPQALNILTHTAYPTDLSQFPTEVTTKLRNSWLDIMFIFLDDPFCDFSKIVQNWTLLEKANLWVSIQKVENCSEYFKFLQIMIERCLQREKLELKDIDLLANWLKKMQVCGYDFSTTNLIEKLTKMGEALIKQSTDLFSHYETALASVGIETLTVHLRLIYIDSKIEDEQLDILIKNLVQALSNIDENIYLKKEFQNDTNLWSLIREDFLCLFDSQFEEKPFFVDDLKNVLEHILPLIRLPIYKELLKQEQSISKQSTSNCTLLKTVGRAINLICSLEKSSEYLAELNRLIDGLTLKPEREIYYLPSKYVEELSASFLTFYAEIKKPSLEYSLTDLKSYFEEGLCLSNDKHICSLVLDLIVSHLNGTRPWVKDNPDLEIDCLMYGLRLLNHGKIPFSELVSLIPKLLKILKENNKPSSFNTLYILFEGMNTLISDKPTFDTHKEILLLLRELLEKFPTDEKNRILKRKLLFKVDVNMAETCIKFGTYVDCADVLASLEKKDFKSLKFLSISPYFIRLCESLSFMRKISSSKGQSLAPDVVKLATKIRGDQLTNFSVFSEIGLRLAILESEYSHSTDLINYMIKTIDQCLGQKEVSPGLILRAIWALSEVSTRYKNILELWKAFINNIFKSPEELKPYVVDFFSFFLRRIHKNSEATNAIIGQIAEFLSAGGTYLDGNNKPIYDKIFDSIEENLRLNQRPDLIHEAEDLYCITNLTGEELKQFCKKGVNRSTKLFHYQLAKNLLNTRQQSFLIKVNPPRSKKKSKGKKSG